MSSVLPSSFSWGFNPKIEDNNNSKSPVQFKSKRKLHDDEDSPIQKRDVKKNDKFRVTKKEISHKRIKPVQTILGQPLPTNRIVEVLEKKNLQILLNNLISLHPEITNDVYNCAPKPTVSDSVKILSLKIENIISSLPYKVDPTSEYSYLRVKPLIEDFLSALSDYTLNFLPPVESLPANSLEFLDDATNLLHKLPDFEKSSNNYFKNLAYEQLSHTWCICLKEFIKSSNSTTGCHASLLLLINNNWDSKLKKHNELSNNKLTSVVEFFRDEMSWLNDEFESENAKFSNLKNFSINNSPLHGLKENLFQ